MDGHYLTIATCLFPQPKIESFHQDFLTFFIQLDPRIFQSFIARAIKLHGERFIIIQDLRKNHFKRWILRMRAKIN